MPEARPTAGRGRHKEGSARRQNYSRQPMHLTDDEIKEKYLERAIRELNEFSRDLQNCRHCPRGKLMPVLGSGHPQADVMMVKYAATPAEIEEGVAFYGRSGNALMKSFKRLNIDPLVVYGTVCVKCPVADPSHASEHCIARLVEEIAIVQPKMLVVMGEAALRTINHLQLPLSRPLAFDLGQIQPFTPTTDALFVPNIDESLDHDAAKQRFWTAFRKLGAWYDDLPPY